MVVASGVFPYQYVESFPIPNSTIGKFRIPQGVFIAPSAIHWEETMFTLREEYLRQVLHQSGYRSVSPIDTSFKTYGSRFPWLQNEMHRVTFFPDQSGRNLGGIYRNYGKSQPAAVHQKEYLRWMREVFEDVMASYGEKGAGWNHYSTSAEKTSGVIRDWLEFYKDYSDDYTESGILFKGDDYFLDGLLWDRLLDELRLQPIPYFGNSKDVSSATIDFQTPYGNISKYDQYWGALRPRYMMTDGGVPSGWASGIEVCRDITALGGPTGIGGHLVEGFVLSLSGGGAGDDGTVIAVSGDWKSDLDNDNYSSSPRYARFESPFLSGQDTAPSGQYQVILGHPTDVGSFPWGSGGGRVHRSAVYPGGGQYEPFDGSKPSAVINRKFDTLTNNNTFVVTDHAFVYQHADKDRAVNLQSGIYWYYPKSGPSESMHVIDAWPLEKLPIWGTNSNGDSASSGVTALWGSSISWDSIYTSEDENGGVVQAFKGGGWTYDRTNNYIVKFGASGAIATDAKSASGVVIRFNQQMNYQDITVVAGTTINGIYWNVPSIQKLVWDGSNWVGLANIASGSASTDPESSVDHPECTIRLDTSFQLVDAMLEPMGLISYANSRGEYLVLDKVNASYWTDVWGDVNGKYGTTTITWGDLQNADANGSGSFSRTDYNLTYASNITGILNLDDATAKSRIHIGTFFNSEPDNDLYCTLCAFASGAASGTTNRPDIWVAKLDDSSHPFEVTDVWYLHNADANYTAFSNNLGMTVIDGDFMSMEHMEIHENG